jgi:hypothetical protein
LNYFNSKDPARVLENKKTPNSVIPFKKFYALHTKNRLCFNKVRLEISFKKGIWRKEIGNRKSDLGV